MCACGVVWVRAVCVLWSCVRAVCVLSVRIVSCAHMYCVACYARAHSTQRTWHARVIITHCSHRTAADTKRHRTHVKRREASLSLAAQRELCVVVGGQRERRVAVAQHGMGNIHTS